MSENTETAILAGGCFWLTQELLRHREGVISTRVGYTGGENEHPAAGHHPGHAEAVEVIFDPGRTCYRNILEFFFQIHRPDLGEGVVGSDYRSEIFYTSDEQRRIAEDTIAAASDFWGAKIMTKVSKAVRFWEAEAEDQNYLQRYTDGNNQFSPYRSAFAAGELGLYVSVKVANAGQGQGRANQGTGASNQAGDDQPSDSADQRNGDSSVSDRQAKIAALDAEEAEARARRAYWKHVVDELERQIQDYNNEIQNLQQQIERTQENIARELELQADTGDPDEIFEQSIATDRAIIQTLENHIQLVHQFLDALAIRLQEARQAVQQVDEEILACEDRRRRLKEG